MYPSQFDYHRPANVQEALEILAANEDAKILAGGHTLLPAMKLRLVRPTALVDIGQIAELKSISANGSLNIGALATHAQVASSSDVQSRFPALAQATGMVGDRQVRNFGTIGGNIAHADPASDPPTVLVGANAIIHMQGPGGSRAVAAEDFFFDFFDTDLADDELVTRIEVPDMGRKKSAYVKLPHQASRYAVVGACAVIEMDGDTCTSARLIIGGSTPKPMRCPDAEGALVGQPLTGAVLDRVVDAMAALIVGECSSDVSSPAEYKLAMSGVFLRKAIHMAASS